MDRQVAARAQQRQTVEIGAAATLSRPFSRWGSDVGHVCASNRLPSATGTREWMLSTGTDAVWAAVSHGDVIKAILADALSMHLDSFQRIVVDPASISIVRYTAARPYLITANSTTADLAAFLSPPRKKARQPPDEDLRRRSRGRRTRRRRGCRLSAKPHQCRFLGAARAWRARN